MEDLRELSVVGQLPALEAFTQAAIAAAQGHWTFERKSEGRAGGFDDPYFVFARSGTSGLPSSRLYLMQKSGEGLQEQGEGRLKVVNIGPVQTGSLSPQQYNRIVEDFHACVVTPASEGIRVVVSFTEAHQGIAHLMTSETYALLTLFSSAANKSTGSAHPADLERWFQFLIAAHRENTPLDSTTLAIWLIEEEEWPEEQAGELVSEYDFGSGLLRQASAQRVI